MSADNIENTIFGGILSSEQFARKVLPFLKEEYFASFETKTLYNIINNFYSEYSKQPTKEVLKIEVESLKNLNADKHSSVKSYIKSVDNNIDVDFTWLENQTEKFCRDRAIYNALMKSISIAHGEEKELSQDSIPSILSEAISVSFNKEIGLDLLEDDEKRYELYHRKESKIPFRLELLNKITKGGVPRKTLSCVAAGTGGGKSIFGCDHAAWCLSQGLNVLYVTLEMAEERIAERIDANLIGCTTDELLMFTKEQFTTKISKLKTKTNGKLIIKEYPTAGAHAGHVKALLDEIKIKKNVSIDVLIVDYLGIFAAQRYKNSGNVNSYSYMKAAAEELRGLAMEYDLSAWTFMQLNREGIGNSDADITNTSDSMGTTHTFDLMLVQMMPEELSQINQVMIKQLKNRFGALDYYKRFVVGLDKSRMMYYNLEEDKSNQYADSGKTDDDYETNNAFTKPVKKAVFTDFK